LLMATVVVSAHGDMNLSPVTSPKTESARGVSEERGVDDILKSAQLREGEDYTILTIRDHSIDELITKK